MRDVLLARWAELGDKIVTMAEEFPQERYDTSPVPGVRSFADQLRHVAFWNVYVQKTLLSEAVNGDANELPRDEYPTRERIAAALRKSFDDVKGAFARNGNGNGPSEAACDTMVTFIEHNGEHYGQLAVYYRLNGLVPPASR
jgi:uncharacterized damage-inducible protein DinB